jgi:2-octaprenyl-6-methoxyphenol hydroxylase
MRRAPLEAWLPNGRPRATGGQILSSGRPHGVTDFATVAGYDRVMASHTDSYDVIVVGAGLTGTLLGVALGTAGLRTAVIERTPPARMTETGYDGRTTAVALATQRMYQALGLWPALAAHAEPILAIRISDAASDGRASPLHLHFDHRQATPDVDDAPPMGWIVENPRLRATLFHRLTSLAPADLIAPAEIAGIERDADRATVRLQDGRILEASVVASAEGRGGTLRDSADITTLGWQYPQTAIVCTAAHEQPHGGVAHEKFLPGGPFAILPMTDDGQGQHRSSIVWTERPAIAQSVMALDEAGFTAELSRRFGSHLGAVRPVGPRFTHPLSLLHAGRYVERRLALVGDAAHGIHPIAGQGYNLGARDVAALAEVLVEAKRLGLDIGAADALARYERWRRFDNTTLVAATDLLNWLFSNDIAPLRLMRDAGLAAVNRVAPLKRLFMRHAMGVLGDLPRLARGEAL